MDGDVTISKEQLDELLGRMKRVETRVTRFLETQGFDTQVRRPEMRNGHLEVPSMRVALEDCRTAVGGGGGVHVYHKGEHIGFMQFTKARP